MLCIKCKKEIAEGSAFCNWCGKKQTVEKRKSRKRANAQGSVYKLSGNRTKPYAAVLPAKYDKEGTKKQRYLGYFASKTEALNALNVAVSNNVTDRINFTFSMIYNEWSVKAYPELSVKSVKAYQTAYNHLEALHKLKMRDIRATDVQSIIDNMSDKAEACKKIRVLYSQLCKYAMSLDIISQNYSQFLKIKSKEKKEKEVFTIEEIRLLHENSNNNDTAKIILILIFTGLRIGELFDITTDNVYLQNNPPRMIGGKKTEAGTDRLIPIHSGIMEFILYFYNKDKKYLIGNSKGGRMDEKNFREREYYPLLKQLGIERKTPHCTRHTFATMLQAKGAKPEDMIKVIGHTDYKTTTENYIHQNIDTLYEMIELLEI